MNRRDQLRRLFAGVLQQLDVPRRVADHLDAADLHHRDLLVIAFGKAARPMAEAVLTKVPPQRLRGLVVVPPEHGAPLPPFEVIAGGHPLPDEGSLAAARRALELCRDVRTDEHVLFLVSGGGSAMLELPADERVTLAELRALHRALVGCGADITAINTVRRHLSAVKGGRLGLAAANARGQRTLAVSDVPRGDVASLASGPTVADPSTIADCITVLDQFRLWPAVPPLLAERLRRGDLPAPLAPDHRLLARSTFEVVLDERHAGELLANALRGIGLLVAAEPVDGWHHVRAADHLLQRLLALHAANPNRGVAIVTTGELSVPLPEASGTGGRNQQFALACAPRIAGRPITVLSCGTDGIDGNSPATGAVVDGTTLARAEQLGLDVTDALSRCDAFPLLDALDDTVKTGPTGVNVRDLRILLHEP